MAYLGLTDADLARAFGVSEATLCIWKTRHPAFSKELQKARDAPGAVAATLYRRARGYTRKAEKVFAHAIDGQVVVTRVETREYYPPDVKAAIRILEASRPDKWGRVPAPADISVSVTVDSDADALAGA